MNILRNRYVFCCSSKTNDNLSMLSLICTLRNNAAIGLIPTSSLGYGTMIIEKSLVAYVDSVFCPFLNKRTKVVCCYN